MDKIICVGLNYQKHADESDMPAPEHPILFSKYKNSLSGHEEKVAIPREATQVDYEAELAIVIGKEAKDVPAEEALDYVFGYTCSNDLSEDRKSTRLNFSHVSISYAVFCLKKKTRYTN